MVLISLAFSLTGYYENNSKKTTKAIVLWFITLFLIAVIALIPSTKDAYIIYGVGSILDNVKSIETHKQLPDRAVRALNLWMDKQAPDSLTNKNKQ